MSVEWAARASCPQCGAEVDVEVGGAVLSCGFCRSNLYLATPGPLEYRLPTSPAHAGDDLFHLPYWRIRGLRFAALADPPEVVSGLLDLTVPATRHLPADARLGVRPQAVPLVLSPGLPSSILWEISREAAIDDAMAGVPSQGPTRLECLIGEGNVILHAPHRLREAEGGTFLEEAFPDGIRRPLTPQAAQALRDALAAARPATPFRFLPLQCPECGAALPAETGATALVCPHCTLAWRVEGGSLRSLPYEIRGRRKGDERLFPFWALALESETIPLRTMADLSKLAEPYRSFRAGWDERPCEVLAPAFKIGPNVFLRLARMMTLGTQDIEATTQERGARLTHSEAVRLPADEAREALPAILCALAVAKRKMFPVIAEAPVSVRGEKLVFFPFARRGVEWFHEETGQALRLEAVRYGANL